MKKFLFMIVIMMMVVISGVCGYVLASSDTEVKTVSEPTVESETKEKDDDELVDTFVELNNCMEDVEAEEFTFEGETLVMVTYERDDYSYAEVFSIEEIRDEFKKLGDL